MNESDAKEQTAPVGEPDYLWMYAVVITFLIVTGLLAAEPVPAERIAAPAVAWTEPFPPLTDCMMLPCCEVAEANHRLALAHWQWLRDRKLFDPENAAYWQARQDESCASYDLWWKIMLATAPGATRTQRREYLEWIRRQVGYGAYYNGAWPPAVPLHRFEEIGR